MLIRLLQFVPLLAALSGCLACPAFAQGPEPETRAERQKLEAEGVRAFNLGDFAEAERAFRAWHELRPTDWIPLYNLATVVSLQKRDDEAAELLARAVELGFVDFRLLERDGAMQRLAHTTQYQAIIAGWRAKQDAAIDRRIEQSRRAFSRRYRYEKDEANRLAFASGFPDSAFDRIREEIDRLNRFFREQVLPEGEPLVIAEGDRPEPWVMVVLPTPADYAAWAKRNYGPRWQQIGGAYDNDRRELVAKDLGPTFRHEFFHVLHWRHINRQRRGQPTWIMEGLCSLVEDVRIADDGRITPLPSWRTNSVKRLAAAGKAPSLRELFRTNDDAFTASRPLANYAFARAVFLYLFERGRLRAWYAEYTARNAQDRTGREAMERVFEKPIEDIEKDFLAWLRQLEFAPEADSPPPAALPVRVGVSAGDGLRVQTSNRASGLQIGDVLTSVDGQPVADGNELARVLSELEIGDEVEVTYRRGARESQTKVRLVGR